jgi:hypothetical protein
MYVRGAQNILAACVDTQGVVSSRVGFAWRTILAGITDNFLVFAAKFRTEICFVAFQCRRICAGIIEHKGVNVAVENDRARGRHVISILDKNLTRVSVWPTPVIPSSLEFWLGVRECFGGRQTT